MKLTPRWFPLAALSIFLATGCSRPALSGPGAKVAAANTSISDNGLDPRSCQNLGPVIGNSGGALGAFVSNDDLLQYAINDLRNNAAEKGANFVHYTAPQFGNNHESDTGVTVAGTKGTPKPRRRRRCRQLGHARELNRMTRVSRIPIVAWTTNVE